jgi:hypothetical protein
MLAVELEICFELLEGRAWCLLTFPGSSRVLGPDLGLTHPVKSKAVWQISSVAPHKPLEVSRSFISARLPPPRCVDYKSLHGSRFIHAHCETSQSPEKGFFSSFNSICSFMLRTGNLCLSHAVFICFFTPSSILNLILLCLFTKQRDKSPAKAEPLLDFYLFYLLPAQPSLRAPWVQQIKPKERGVRRQKLFRIVSW